MENSRIRLVFLFLLGLIIALANAPATIHAAGQKSDEFITLEDGTKVRTPELFKTVDIRQWGSAVYIKRVVFSPNSQFIALAINELAYFGRKIDYKIVIVDARTGKEISRIPYPADYLPELGDMEYFIFWSPDSKIIRANKKYQWEAQTGKALPDNPIEGKSPALNKDGSKLLTHFMLGGFVEPSYVYIYDTSSWELQKIWLDGLVSVCSQWTSDDRIVVTAKPSIEIIGKTLDGYQIKSTEDIVLRLIDPKGQQPTITRWFPANYTPDKPLAVPDKPLTHYSYSFSPCPLGKSNFARNSIISGDGITIDGRTLEVSYWPNYIRKWPRVLSDKEYRKLREDGKTYGDQVLSRDGKLIYLRGDDLFVFDEPAAKRQIPNRIIDPTSGQVLISFGNVPHGVTGIDASPDGTMLAIGSREKLEIYHL